MELPREEIILTEIAKERSACKRVVFTNGCFDIIHLGHVRYLTQAKSLGGLLVVGLNSDASVSRLKGPARPLVAQAERAEVLLGLKAVDYVLVFDEDTPLCIIQALKPDVLVKGGDWPVANIVGADFVRSYGGEVLSLPYVEGKSSTDIIQKIRETLVADGQ